MKTLLVMRHAKSSWENSRLDDFDRPLNDRGQRDAPRMGRWVASKRLVPQLVISSTANRAQLTTDLFVDAVQRPEAEIEPIKIVRRDRLYHGDPSDYRAELNLVSAVFSIVMVVGHNPGLEHLIESLTGYSERMSTAAIAAVQCPLEDWAALEFCGDYKLADVWRPKEISVSFE